MIRFDGIGHRSLGGEPIVTDPHGAVFKAIEVLAKDGSFIEVYNWRDQRLHLTHHGSISATLNDAPFDVPKEDPESWVTAFLRGEFQR